jgi:hypothetical protein
VWWRTAEQEQLVLLWFVVAAARTAAEREAMYKEIDALYEVHEYVEPCEVNLGLPSQIW